MNRKNIKKIAVIAGIAIWVGACWLAWSLHSGRIPFSAPVKTSHAAPPIQPLRENDGTPKAADQPKNEHAYKTGDRLQQKKSGKTSDLTEEELKAGYREITWDDLVPRNWDPMAPFKGMNLDKMQDNDPRAAEALFKARRYWRNAPVEPKMEGVSVRIPGFVVSLDREGEGLREFLLVPYFGGCIHVPPPPANQIIHVRSEKAIPGIRTMDAVWVSGTLEVRRADTGMGAAGYSMKANTVGRYAPPPAD